MNTRSMLQPRALARIRDLRLMAQLIVEGSLHGLHRSRQLGDGMEFTQYRGYEPGDEPRRLDWRLYARSDKLFVRQSERESHVAVWLLIDASASMAQPCSNTPEWTRFHSARAIAASLAWLSQQQGDRFGLISLSNDGPVCLPLDRDGQHLDRLLVALHRLEPNGRWPGEQQFDALWQPLQTPGLIVLISDFFQQDDEIESLVAKLQAGGQEVVTVQLLTEDEHRFSFSGNIQFVDRETGDVVNADATAVRDDYLTRFDEAQTALARKLASLGVRHFSAHVEQPLDTVLWQFLKAREQLSAGPRARIR